MKTFRFLDFGVYQEARNLYLRLLNEPLTDAILRNQLLRASLSVALNIAEGSAKSSDKDFARYLTIALGSVNESVACLDIITAKNGLHQNKYQDYIIQYEAVAKQLGGFKKKLYS